MRVAQVIDRVHVSGGAEHLQYTFAEALDPRIVELTVITLRDSLPEAVAALRDRGVRVVAFPSRAFADPKRARELVRFVREERFALLHAHLVRATVLAGLAGRLTGTPVVATLHNTVRRSGVGPTLRAAEHWVLRNAVDRVIAVGWETARAHRATLAGCAIDVIPNAVVEPLPLDPRARADVRAELGVPEGAPLLLSVGRIVPQKAPIELLHAFAQLPATTPAPELRYVGVGRLEPALAREIDHLGLGARVRRLGLRSDVPRLLAASDLFVSASHWEGLPVAMLEAMAAGLAIVATRVGDVPRVLDPSMGVLVPPHDPDALTNAIAGLLADPARREALGAAARAHARADFSTPAWAARHLALYAEVVRGRGSHVDLEPPEETRCAS
jgi:glycosyltransferase involved in cell wall biosynthesis